MLSSQNNNVIQFGFLFSLIILLTMVACTKEEDDNVVVEPKETVCRITKVMENGELKREFIYGSTGLAIRENFYNDGEIDFYSTYSYDLERKMKVINDFNSDGERSYTHNLMYNVNGVIIEIESWRIPDTNEEISGRSTYNYTGGQDCSLEEINRFDSAGSLVRRTQYEFIDSNCSYEARYFTGSSGQLEYLERVTKDDRKGWYKPIHFNTGRGINNTTKKESELPDGTTARTTTYDLTYNEFDYPIRSGVTDSNGDSKVIEYEYICE